MTNRKIYNLSEDRFYNSFLKSQLAEYMFSALESEIYILHFYSGLEAIEICLALDLSNLEFETIRDRIFFKLNVPDIRDKTAHLRKFITNRYIEFSKNEYTNIKYNNYSREKAAFSLESDESLDEKAMHLLPIRWEVLSGDADKIAISPNLQLYPKQNILDWSKIYLQFLNQEEYICSSLLPLIHRLIFQAGFKWNSVGEKIIYRSQLKCINNYFSSASSIKVKDILPLYRLAIFDAVYEILNSASNSAENKVIYAINANLPVKEVTFVKESIIEQWLKKIKDINCDIYRWDYVWDYARLSTVSYLTEKKVGHLREIAQASLTDSDLAWSLKQIDSFVPVSLKMICNEDNLFGYRFFAAKWKSQIENQVIDFHRLLKINRDITSQKDLKNCADRNLNSYLPYSVGFSVAPKRRSSINLEKKGTNYISEKCPSISDCLVKKNDDSKTILSFNSLDKRKCHTSLSIEGFFEELNPAVETMNYEKFKELFNRVDFPDSLISEAIKDACNANEKVVCIRENKHTRLSLIVWNPEFKTSAHTHPYYYDAIWVVKGIVTQISFNGSAESIQDYKSGSKIVLPFPIKHMLSNNTNQMAVTVNVQHSPVSELKPLSFPIHN